MSPHSLRTVWVHALFWAPMQNTSAIREIRGSLIPLRSVEMTKPRWDGTIPLLRLRFVADRSRCRHNFRQNSAYYLESIKNPLTFASVFWFICISLIVIKCLLFWVSSFFLIVCFRFQHIRLAGMRALCALYLFVTINFSSYAFAQLLLKVVLIVELFRINSK